MSSASHSVSALSFVESASEEFYTNGVLNKSILGTDGFIPVTRRILYSLFTMAPGEYKSPELIARTLRVHPHGDSSVESALSSLAHPWRYPLPPIDFIGNSGTLVTPAAAARYTSVSGDCFVGKYIRKYLPFVERYVGESHEDEVDYIPMPYPVLLTSGFSQAVGTGISSQYINHSFESVMDLASEMVTKAEDNILPLKPKTDLIPYYFGSGIMSSAMSLHESRGIASYEADYEIKKHSKTKFTFLMKSSLGRIASEKVYSLLQEKYSKTFLGFMNQTTENGLQVEITFATGKDLKDLDDIVNLIISRMKLGRVLNVKQIALVREITDTPGSAMPAEITKYGIMSDWLMNTYDLVDKGLRHDKSNVQSQIDETKLRLYVARNTESVVKQNKTGDYSPVAAHMGATVADIAPLVQKIPFGALNEQKLLKTAADLSEKESNLNIAIDKGIKNLLPLIDATVKEFKNNA